MALTPYETYFFDINGYLLVEDVVPPGLLAEAVERSRELQSTLDLQFPHEPKRPGARPGNSIPQVAAEEPVYLRMCFLPRVLSRMVDLVHTPNVRSSWLSYSLQGGHVAAHGNRVPFCPVVHHAVVDGKIYAASLIVIIALEDIPEDGAALRIIPGSHKANFAVPGDESDVEPMWVTVPQPAGSALLITHDVYHGSRNRRDYVRRTFHVGYGPGCQAYADGRPPTMFDGFRSQAPAGSWREYLLRPPGSQDFKQPTGPIEDEYDDMLAWRPERPVKMEACDGACENRRAAARSG